MDSKYAIYIFLLGFSFILNSQTIKGKVIDAQTKEPLESVAIYFDNTTVGTTTDKAGIFSLNYNDAIVSGLIISYLGYETIMLSDYRQNTYQNIALRPSINELDEVVINEDDGLTRKQKLRLFRREFLGESYNGNRCKILNEEDIYLRYFAEDKTLIASSSKPLIIVNKALSYRLNYTMVDFKIEFSYVELENDVFNPENVGFAGTIFYEDLEGDELKKSISKRRLKTYKGSVQHFMRALFFDKLTEESYKIFYKGFIVKPEDYLKASKNIDSTLREVKIDHKLNILFNKEIRSYIQPMEDYFYVDQYGNHSPVNSVLFGGDMGRQRIGDILPLDYGLSN